MTQESNNIAWRRSSAMGISAYRAVTDIDPLLELRGLLQEEFGDAIRADSELTAAESLTRATLLGKSQTATPVAEAMATHNIDRPQAFNVIADSIPDDLWKERRPRINRFAVFEHPLRSDPMVRGVVSVSLADNFQYAADRRQLIDIFDTVSQSKHKYGDTISGIVLGQVIDRSAIKDIRRFRMSQRTSIPLGRLTLSRKTKNSSFDCSR